MALFLKENNIPFETVFMDTNWKHPATLDSSMLTTSIQYYTSSTCEIDTVTSYVCSAVCSDGADVDSQSYI